MFRTRIILAALPALIGLLLSAPRTEAQPFVSVGVGPGRVNVSVGRGPFYFNYSSGIAPGYPYIVSRYYTYGWGNYPLLPGVYTPSLASMIYPPPSPADTYRYSPPTYSYNPPQLGSRSFYPPSPATPQAAPAAAAQDSNTVVLNIRLPDPNAELWIEGTRTTRQGTERQFVSPPLTPGRKYSYEVQARWFENGREVNQTRRVVIQAGDQLTIDFTRT